MLHFAPPFAQLIPSLRLWDVVMKRSSQQPVQISTNILHKVEIPFSTRRVFADDVPCWTTLSLCCCISFSSPLVSPCLSTITPSSQVLEDVSVRATLSEHPDVFQLFFLKPYLFSQHLIFCDLSSWAATTPVLPD